MRPETDMNDAISTTLSSYVDRGEFAGAVTLVFRDGQLRHVGAVGWRNKQAEQALQRDSLFRIASISKPITSLAAMVMLEEGRFSLTDPISKWAPEFAAMQVLASPTSAMDDTVAAERQITFEDLLTHRAGFNYGETFSGATREAYDKALGGHVDSPVSPDAWIAGLAGLPLIAQPGAGFTYGHATDLLGLLIARIDGTSLGDLLQRRIFGPLGMKDTGFSVSADKRERRAAMYGFDYQGALLEKSSMPGAFMEERPIGMAYESGGQGLWSTVDDILAFGRVFVGGGTVDGVQIVSEETLKLMTTNRLTPRQREEARLLGMPVFEAHGFGLGVAVVMDPDKASVLRCKGGVGTVGWPGAYGGWWQADPTDGSVMVFLAHNSFELEQLAMGVGLGVYAAITDFHALAVKS